MSQQALRRCRRLARSLALALALAILVVAGAPARALAGPDVEALVVGNNHSFKSSLPELKFAESDAHRFAEAMMTVGLVPQATALTEPTRAEFRTAFRNLAAGAKRRKFIFYYSGHSDENGLHLSDGLITKTELHDMLTAVPAVTKIAILDSCFSGAITARGVERSSGFELPRMEYDEPSGSVFLSAASGRQLAYESDELAGGVFTHHLLRGIYGDADGNGDGAVTVDELYQYVYRNTKWQSLNYPVATSQEPEFRAQLSGHGAIVLSFPARTTGRVVLGPSLAGEIAIAAARGLQFFRMQKGEGEERSVQLPVGTYRISVRDGVEVGTGEITVDQNGVTTLAHADLAWSGTTTQPARGAKGAEAAAPATERAPSASAAPVAAVAAASTAAAPAAIAAEIKAPRPPASLHLDARAGVHSGYARNSHWGPLLAVGATWERPLLGRWRWQYGGELSAHQNRARQKYSFSTEFTGTRGDVTTTSSALLAVTALAYRIPFGSAAFVSAIDLGYGQAYHEQRFSKGDPAATALTPVRSIGLGFAIETSPDHRIGLAMRQDSMDTSKVSQAASRAAGMAVAMTTRF